MAQRKYTSRRHPSAAPYEPKRGDRVVFVKEVCRYPHALIPVGATGRVVYADKDVVDKGEVFGIVVLDDHYPGLDEWDNEIYWCEVDWRDFADALHPVKEDDDVEALLDLIFSRPNPNPARRYTSRRRPGAAADPPSTGIPRSHQRRMWLTEELIGHLYDWRDGNPSIDRLWREYENNVSEEMVRRARREALRELARGGTSGTLTHPAIDNLRALVDGLKDMEDHPADYDLDEDDGFDDWESDGLEPNVTRRYTSRRGPGASRPPPRIVETYEIYTPDDVEHGDAGERGFINEEGWELDLDDEDESIVDQAVQFLEGVYVTEPSGTWFQPGVWYTAYGDADIRTGDRENRSYHLKDFTPEEEEEIFNRLAL